MADLKPEAHDFKVSKLEEGYFSEYVITKHEKVDIYLTGTMEEGKFYTGIEHKLRQLNKEDVVNFYLRNYGGTINGLNDLVSGIKDSQAHQVNMIVTAPSYSCGALIALCGTSLTMKPNTFLMFHNYSSGGDGKGGEFMESAKQHDKWIKQLMRSMASPFLTDDEIIALDHDQDLYIMANDKGLKSRCNRHFNGK